MHAHYLTLRLTKSAQDLDNSAPPLPPRLSGKTFSPSPRKPSSERSPASRWNQFGLLLNSFSLAGISVSHLERVQEPNQARSHLPTQPPRQVPRLPEYFPHEDQCPCQGAGGRLPPHPPHPTHPLPYPLRPPPHPRRPFMERRRVISPGIELDWTRQQMQKGATSLQQMRFLMQKVPAAHQQLATLRIGLRALL